MTEIDSPKKAKRLRRSFRSASSLLALTVCIIGQWAQAIRNTLEFFLSPTCDAQAAKHFFVNALVVSVPQVGSSEAKAVQSAGLTDLKASRSAPPFINVDKNAVYPKANPCFNASRMFLTSVEFRHVTYLNTLIE